MKFREPNTGEVFEDIQNARIAFCVGRTCSEDCPFGCAETIERDPVKAAHLMRLELVEDDIDLINRIAKTPLTESEVYTFSVRLCDNEIDRDYERFSTQTLEKLAKMFAGKPGIFDNQCSARIYRTELVRDAEKTTAAGDEYCCLKGWAYMLRNEQSKDVIAEIEAGIKKEVSVGCAVERSVCSICGADIGTCRHVKGKTYDGRMCFGELRNPTDVYEWSFIATSVKKEEPMEKMDKPRIAQVLGLEVGERFSIDGYPTDYGLVKVCEDGKIRRVVSTQEFPFAEEGEVGHKIGSNALYYLLNHPDRIIRKPRFTEEEVADAKVLMRALRATGLKRNRYEDIYATSDTTADTLLDSEMFPSLRPGQAITLSDITGGSL